MGLFSKKYCSICGQPAGVLGKEKLSDGLVCKKCAAGFSPFWSVWKSTTVSEVQAHLKYREQNRVRLSHFSPSIRIGEEYALFIDPESGMFAMCSYTALQSENPDVFNLKDVLDCTYDIKLSQYRGDENESDYYLYYFYLVVRLDNQNIRTARFRINEKALRADKRPVLHDQIEQVYAGYRELRGAVSSAITGIDRKASQKYLSYYALLQDMIHALSDYSGRQKNQANAAQARFCPWCGTPSQGAFCPSCGKKISLE